MLTALIVIAGLTLLATLVRPFMGKRICPICIGVSASWLIGLVLYYSGIYTDQTVLAILMGASLGAVVTLYGKSWGLLMKSVVFLVGFPTVYYLIQKDVAKAVIGMMALTVCIVLAHVFKQSLPPGSDAFDSCCS